MFTTRKFRTLLILVAWLGMSAVTFFAFGSRPFVIDNVHKYWVSNKGSLLATCEMQAPESSSSIKFWNLHKSELHATFELPIVEEGWIPEKVIFSSTDQIARVWGLEFDLVDRSILPKREIPVIPGIVFWEEVLFDENDQLVGRFLGDYWDVTGTKIIHKLALPGDWHSYSPRGNLHIYWHEKNMTILDKKRRTIKKIELQKNSDDCFQIAPSGDYCGYYGSDREYCLFSIDKGTEQKIKLPADYGVVEISPHATYLFCCAGQDESVLEFVWEKLGKTVPPAWHLVDPKTARVIAKLRSDNHDWIETPVFSADNSYVFTIDRQQSRLSVWQLPIEDATTLKLVSLFVCSAGAVAATYLTRKRTAA